MEKHVKPHREAKRDIKAKLREDLNITATVFNARYGECSKSSRRHFSVASSRFASARPSTT